MSRALGREYQREEHRSSPLVGPTKPHEDAAKSGGVAEAHRCLVCLEREIRGYARKDHLQRETSEQERSLDPTMTDVVTYLVLVSFCLEIAVDLLAVIQSKVERGMRGGEIGNRF